MASMRRRGGWRMGRGPGLEMKVRRLITIRTLTHRRPLVRQRRCFDADGTALVGRRGRLRGGVTGEVGGGWMSVKLVLQVLVI